MKMGVIESRFADLIWQREPIATSELIKIGEKEFCWKRTTTYTVLKRLRDFSKHKWNRDLSDFPQGVLFSAKREVCGGNVSRLASSISSGFY